MEVPTATLMALSSSFSFPFRLVGWFSNDRDTVHVVNVIIRGDQASGGLRFGGSSPCLPGFSSAFPSPSFRQFWLILFHSIRYHVSIAVILNRLLSHPIILLSCAARIHCANVLGLSMSMHHSANPRGRPCANIRRFAGSSSFIFARRAKTANVVTYSST